MRTLILTLPILLAPALAQDGTNQDLQNLLNSIPDIEQKAPPPDPNAKPPEEASIDLPTYIGEVRKAVLANWHPSPKVLKKAPGASTQLLVKVQADGTLAVSETRVARSSENSKFDESAVAAVFATTSVPAPPVSLQGTVAMDGVLVTFAASQAPK